MRALPSFLAAVATALSASGCVERTLRIETDPPGATVVVDFSDFGAGPVTIPFDHYGTRRVEARLDGYETLRQEVPVRPPWYQWFPLELVSEILVPWTIRDHRTVTLTLVPTERREETLLMRAEEARRFDPRRPDAQQ